MNRKCYVIAEAGLNHNGSLQMARQLVQEAAAAGADAVKFQKRDVDSLAVAEVLDADDDRFPSLGKTYREIREQLEFSFEQFGELKALAEEKGLSFLCTPFDIPSAQFLERLEVKSFKIASHSVTNLPLLRYVAERGKPVFLSSGMCTFEELDRAVEIFRTATVPLTVLHCVSSYPQGLQESNLGLLSVLRERYHLPIGYSGHEIGYLPTLLAVAIGAEVVERHFTLDNTLEGFDHKLSLEGQELTEMISKIREIEAAMGDGEKQVTEREMITRRKYHVSAVSNQPIATGTQLTAEMIDFKNPGTGIAPHEVEQLLGKKVLEDIAPDRLLERDMFS